VVFVPVLLHATKPATPAIASNRSNVLPRMGTPCTLT
jgi:hypothetical protein